MNLILAFFCFLRGGEIRHDDRGLLLAPDLGFYSDRYVMLLYNNSRNGLNSAYFLLTKKNTEKKLPQLGKAALWFYALFTQHILLPQYPSMSQTDTPNSFPISLLARPQAANRPI